MLQTVVMWLRKHRWSATHQAARLGVVAAALCGVALALHLGGRDGYTVPLSGLLGMPTNGYCCDSSQVSQSDQRESTPSGTSITYCSAPASRSTGLYSESSST